MDSAPKPFSLQQPEEVAKAYGGNKNNIARAVMQGIIDPTSAIMAGMFIDRIRQAAVAEQASDSTVMDDVFDTGAAFNPQPQGLAGLPNTVSQTEPAAPGVDAIPVDDNAVPSMASGGLVAFAQGGEPQATSEEQQMAAYRAQFAKMYPQMADDGSLAQLRAELTPQSPEDTEKQRKRDMWEALALFGSKLAGSNSPYFLQAAGQAASETIPQIQQTQAQRKQERRADARELRQISLEEYKTRIAQVQAELNYVQKQQEVAETRNDRTSKEKLAADAASLQRELTKLELEARAADRASEERRTLMSVGATKYAADAGARGMISAAQQANLDIREQNMRAGLYENALRRAESMVNNDPKSLRLPEAERLKRVAALAKELYESALPTVTGEEAPARAAAGAPVPTRVYDRKTGKLVPVGE